MNKVNVKEVAGEFIESPRKQYGILHKSISLSLRDPKRRQPFDVAHVTLAPGKKNWPYHRHGAQWEMYVALKGTAKVRIEGSLIGFEEGDFVLCPPGDAHQIINESAAEFEYLAISDNPEFDTEYYPDSDKVSVSPRLGANQEGTLNNWGKQGLWTRFKDGLVKDYWEGEE